MKWSVRKVFVTILLIAGTIFLMRIPRHIHAQTAPAGTIMQRPNSNVTEDLTKVESVILEIGNRFGIDVSGFIVPQDNTTAVPDLKNQQEWLTKSEPWLQPDAIKPDIKEDSIPKTASSRYRLCISQTLGGKETKEPADIESEGTEESQEIAWIPPLTKSGEFFNALLGRRRHPKNQLDFTRPNPVISDPDPCGAQDKGKDQNSTNLAVAQVSAFGSSANFVTSILQQILAWFSPDDAAARGETPAKLTKSVVLARSEDFGCNIAGCRQEEAKNAPEDRTSIHDLVENGGFSQTFLPALHQNVDTPDGKTQNTYTIGSSEINLSVPWNLTNRTDELLARTQCSILPSDLQTQYQLSGKCNPEPYSQPAGTGTCDKAYFDQFDTAGSGGGTGGSAGSLPYVIPYRNTSCKLAADMIPIIGQFADSWIDNQGNAVVSIQSQWQNIQTYAMQYQWNPLFIMTLWIEESGAGEHPNAGWHLGCLYGWGMNEEAITMPKIGQTNGDLCNQMACLFSHPNRDPNNFERFMCSYDTLAQISPGVCPAYNQWGFAQRIHDIYLTLYNNTGRPDGCEFSTDNVVAP